MTTADTTRTLRAIDRLTAEVAEVDARVVLAVEHVGEGQREEVAA